jgi:flagellar hook-length control protein FliK
VSRIDALNFSFQPSSIQPTKEITDTQVVKETMNFAELFSSLTTEGQEVSAEMISENPQVDLLERIEEIVQYLQELPQKMLSVDEEEMVYGSIQMLSSQLITEEVQLNEQNSSQGKPLANHQAEEKLMSLIQQVSQELEKLVATSVIGESAVDVTKRLAEPIKLEQVLQQLVAVLQSFGKKQQAVNKPLVEQFLQQIKSPAPETKSLVQVTATPLHNGQNLDTIRLVTQQAEVSISPILQSTLSTQTEESSQPQALTLDIAQNSLKVTQPTVHRKYTEPTPTVRMSNLIEELSTVLRGSFRLTGNPEGTQIRVNITPDHLGHLDIRFTEINGKIAAHIFTSTLAAKETMDQQMNQLRSLLLQQGIPLDKIEVSQQNLQSFEQQTDHRFSQKRREKQEAASDGKNEYERLDEEMTVERHQLSDLSMNVNYTV